MTFWYIVGLHHIRSSAYTPYSCLWQCISVFQFSPAEYKLHILILINFD